MVYMESNDVIKICKQTVMYMKPDAAPVLGLVNGRFPFFRQTSELGIFISTAEVHRKFCKIVKFGSKTL